MDVDGQLFQAPKIFINVGGRKVLPEWPGLARVPVLTNTSVMVLDVLPEHLIIVGGSYIGLEFAQMFRRFGAKVTVPESGNRLIGREDPEVSTEVQAILEREGVRFVLGGCQCAGRAAEPRRLRVVHGRRQASRDRRQPLARSGQPST